MADRSIPHTVKVRVEAEGETSAKVADQVADLLEQKGLEIIELSKSFPMRDEPGRFRTYVTGIHK